VSTAPARDALDSLVGFARTLRAGGVDATPDRVQAMVAALVTCGAGFDASHSADVYWAGRLTLCSGPDDLPRYDRAFAAWFGRGELPALRSVLAVRVPREVALPGAAGPPGQAGQDPVRTATASPDEVLRQRDVARLTGRERVELQRMLGMLQGPAPVRPSRRLRAARRGPLDAHRTVRAMLERGGEPARLRRHHASVRPRRLVLLLDVSGSMAGYADTVLRYAHACVRRRPGTEVFTLGTRLTRVTREMSLRDPDAALAALSVVIADWSGGTRLGQDLKDFLDRYGQRGTARGALVVVASDGWERGDAGLLGGQMQRLHRLAHRVVWVHPHRARPGYEPATAGMLAALPWVDDLVAGHSLAAFEELSVLLSRSWPGRAAAAGRGRAGQGVPCAT
jgi:uncharacterized protein